MTAGTDIDGRLRTIRDTAREAAPQLRAMALAVDTDPDAMAAHLDAPEFALVRHAGTPDEYREPGTTGRLPYSSSCLENAVGTVELARGDAGVVLAVPAPGLAGALVAVLGDEHQRRLFHTRLHGGRTWTFFAMTEPGGGSDATAMQTRLTRVGDGTRLLHGHKRYVGNAARGGIGVVFARTGRSALSIRAALVELPAPGWRAQRLDTIGLRGAAVADVALDGVAVREDMLLGEHLPVTRRGMWGAITTFNAMRVQVAAAAAGTSLAMAEYVTAHRPSAPGAAVVAARAEAARELVLDAAACVDRYPERSYLSCAAKLAASRTAVWTARWAAGAVGPAGLLEHPLLEKWTRDSGAFEFMEGTGNIQRLHVTKGYQAGDAGPSDSEQVRRAG